MINNNILLTDDETDGKQIKLKKFFYALNSAIN